MASKASGNSAPRPTTSRSPDLHNHLLELGQGIPDLAGNASAAEVDNRRERREPGANRQHRALELSWVKLLLRPPQ